VVDNDATPNQLAAIPTGTFVSRNDSPALRTAHYLALWPSHVGARALDIYAGADEFEQANV
jgi:hypothetical protein